jgi:hypothetical protein
MGIPTASGTQPALTILDDDMVDICAATLP